MMQRDGTTYPTVLIPTSKRQSAGLFAMRMASALSDGGSLPHEASVSTREVATRMIRTRADERRILDHDQRHHLGRRAATPVCQAADRRNLASLCLIRFG